MKSPSWPRSPSAVCKFQLQLPSQECPSSCCHWGGHPALPPSSSSRRTLLIPAKGWAGCWSRITSGKTSTGRSGDAVQGIKPFQKVLTACPSPSAGGALRKHRNLHPKSWWNFDALNQASSSHGMKEKLIILTQVPPSLIHTISSCKLNLRGKSS